MTASLKPYSKTCFWAPDQTAHEFIITKTVLESIIPISIFLIFPGNLKNQVTSILSTPGPKLALVVVDP